jgi:bleomycin hydrolase
MTLPAVPRILGAMKTVSTTLLLLFFLSSAHADDAGALTPDLAARLRDGYKMDDGDRARFNAVTNGDIDALALNRSILRGEDGNFSHRIQSKGITNQKASGRCWMFAGLNVMRPKVIADRKLEGFTFSAAYLQFWDKMEKSNLYLESIIELRDVDFLDRTWEGVNEWTLDDGGWWNYVTGLIEKYGVVPVDVMPETHSSENTAPMNRVLGLLLHAEASKLLEHYRAGATEAQLRASKEDILSRVYRYLVLNLGEPPTEFDWRYKAPKEKDENGKDKKKDEDPDKVTDKDLTPWQHFTPKAFYEEFVAVPLRDYVCLYNDPKQPFGKHYRFERTTNMTGTGDMHFVNIESPLMRDITAKSILANEPVWFAANVSVDQSKEHGLMADRLFDYDTLFGINTRLSKAERTRFLAGASNHAMVFMGVDLRDDQPQKWLVENSWGSDVGTSGTWTMRNDWFDENVYTIIINRSHVPAEILAKFDDAPTPLPAWYPGAAGIPGR